EGRVPVARDDRSNFNLQVGSAEIGRRTPFASGLSASVGSKDVRIAKDEQIVVVLSGVFKDSKTKGMVDFELDRGETVPVGSLGNVTVRASFSPLTTDQRTLYAGESFSRELT